MSQKAEIADLPDNTQDKQEEEKKEGSVREYFVSIKETL